MCHREEMFRLLGLLGGLSLATDLGTGAPLEESLKRCLVAVRLARQIGCDPAHVSDVLYTSLLQHLGCTAYSHETAAVWGDDIGFVRLAFLTDFTDRSDVWRTWVGGLSEQTGRSRARVLATAATTGRKGAAEGPVATCETARDASRGLGLPSSVSESLFHATATWDGDWYPHAAGEGIPLPARLMHAASTAVMFALLAGTDEAVAQVRHRSGTALDPSLVAALVAHAGSILGDLQEVDAYEEVLAAEPDPVRLVDDERLESVARIFGRLADLKSPWLHGHSAAVADLAAAATADLGLDDRVETVRVAGHLHDLGRVAVPSRIWDKAGPLTRAEREQAELHPYHSERVLCRVPALAEVATLTGRHHERCDGSGYHRGLTSAQLTMPARVLAAADEYRDLVEQRPHRPALSSGEAATRLQAEARASRLDPDAVAAVLHAAGHRSGARRPLPAGLTARQVEVLRLVARGCSNLEIAEHLVISRRTAEHHVQDVYLRIGVSSRAAAALFAMEHGLVGESG